MDINANVAEIRSFLARTDALTTDEVHRLNELTGAYAAWNDRGGFAPDNPLSADEYLSALMLGFQQAN